MFFTYVVVCQYEYQFQKYPLFYVPYYWGCSPPIAMAVGYVYVRTYNFQHIKQFSVCANVRNNSLLYESWNAATPQKVFPLLKKITRPKYAWCSMLIRRYTEMEAQFRFCHNRYQPRFARLAPAGMMITYFLLSFFVSFCLYENLDRTYIRCINLLGYIYSKILFV